MYKNFSIYGTSGFIRVTMKWKTMLKDLVKPKK